MYISKSKSHFERVEEGQACIRILRALKPDFAQRRLEPIGRYVEFNEMDDRILACLDKLGMHIES